MLYICIPAYNEAPTIGVLLWQIRSVFQEYAREYELVVYDDGSTDATAEVLEPYARVLPLTVIGGGERRGYAAALDALCRHVAAHTRYPRRDAMIVLQGDFTDRPEHIPELVKRFEGGADIVIGERAAQTSDPVAVRRLHRLAPWLLRPFVRLDGVADLTSGYRLIRISLLRDLIRERGDRPIASAAGWGANAELLLAIAPLARRIETIPAEPRFDVRPRASRVRPLADAMSLVRFGWAARGNRRIDAPERASVATRRPSDSDDTPRDLAPANAGNVADAATPDGSPPPRRDRTRAKRPRPDAPIDASPRGERPPRDREAKREAAPHDAPPRETAPRPPRKPAPAPAAPSPAVEEAIARELDDAVSPPERKRRKRTRRPAKDRLRSELGPDDADAPLQTELTLQPALAEGDAPESAEDGSEVAEGVGRPTKRRRRGRGRRPGAATDEQSSSEPGGDSLGVSESASAESSGPDGEGGDADGDGGESGGAARAGRRSRRGKRRGRRRSAGDGGGEGGESAPGESSDHVGGDADQGDA